MSLVRRFLLFTVLVLPLGAWAQSKWIWVKDARQPEISIEFSRTFELSGHPVSAQLQAVADFSSFDIRINGKSVGKSPSHGPLVNLEVADHLLKGKNLVSITARSSGKAPAVALRLDWTDATGARSSLCSNEKWKAKDSKGGERPIGSFGSLTVEPWWNLPPLTLDSLDDYTQWKRASKAEQGTDPASFSTLPGYEVELLRSAGKEENSWVSMAFDPKGRITIGREDKGLLRFSFSRDRKKIVRTESIEDTLKECRGLLYAYGALYANANNSRALYRLRDLDGDDQFEEKKILYQSEGGVGHGRNDLALGPDGMIYAIHGDSVHIPGDLPNLTSPLRRNRLPYRPSEGHVLRLDKDGKRIEIFCGGLRNPYGIAFNRDGEAFTYDADAENDMGAPWYRPTQIMHLTSGADFGWRAVTGSWPPYYPDHPDNTQSTAHIGKGSPTSVKFGYGSGFPPAYRNALFVLDWTFGRILAVHLIERGAGYLGVPEVFLRGRPLNVTDLAFGPDGAMYFVTGGRRTKSALYRVRYAGTNGPRNKASSQQKLRAKLSGKARDVRRHLEGYHGKPNQEIDDTLLGDGSAGKLVSLWVHLGSPDPRIRQAARIALEHQPLERWRSAALSGNGKPRTLLTSWTALFHADPGQSSAILPKLNKLDLRSLDEDLVLQAVHLYALCLKDLPGAFEEAILAQLRPFYPNQSDKLNWSLASLLIALDPEGAVDQTIELLKSTEDPVQAVHYLYQLRHAKVGWTQASRETYFRKLGEATGYVGDSRGLPTGLKRIGKDALVTLPAGERKRYEALGVNKAKMPPLPDLSGRKFVKNWKPDDFAGELGLKPAAKASASGRKAFEVALCNRCHRFQGSGYAVGPDLTVVANRLGRTDLLRAILLPSESIAQNYRSDLLELADGRTLAGQVIPTLDYRAPYLLLAENPLIPDQSVKIPKVDVLKRKRSDLSIMPPGLLNNLSKQEVLDLLAYLESAGAGN
jgi:putative heme-binding domain-containing protein